MTTIPTKNQYAALKGSLDLSSGTKVCSKPSSCKCGLPSVCICKACKRSAEQSVTQVR